MQEKYSIWHKIDLHIHTDLSKKTKTNDYVGDFSVETLKTKLSENNVSIFSLTDHNIINLSAYEEYYRHYDESTDPLLLVGVELDILVDNDEEQKTYHSLLVFNHSDSLKAKEISEKLETKYSEKELDYTDRKLSIGEIVEIFPNEDFFFIPHAGNTKGIVDAYKGHIEDAQEMVLLMQSAFEKVPQKAEYYYNEGFNERLAEAFRNKNDHAYIKFSDNHNIDAYPVANKGQEGKIHQFYYVKGGKNYETLRLAFIDPESRIKSTEQINGIESPYNYLDSLLITDDVKFKENEISFSPHLNVIIGGRSSGKSLIMALIGDKIDTVKNETEKYEGFEFESAKLKTERDSDYQETVSIPPSEIIYLKQGDIVKYFEENRLSDLAKESGKKDKYDLAKSTFKERKNEVTDVLEDVITSYDDYLQIQTNRYILHHETIEKILSEEYVIDCNLEEIYSEFDLSGDIDKSLLAIGELNRLTSEFSENTLYSFTDEELRTVDDFKLLLSSKLSLIERKHLRNKRKASFWSKVDKNIQSINEKLGLESRQKNQSKQDLRKLKSSFLVRFKRAKILNHSILELKDFDYDIKESVSINERVKLMFEIGVIPEKNISKLIANGINDYDQNKSLYLNILDVANDEKSIKNYTSNSPDDLNKKIKKELGNIFDALENPRDYLDYGDGKTSKNNSPGYNSEKYLEILLTNPSSRIIFIDQPEDNLGNKFISETLVSLIRDIKFEKQIFLVTHNPSIVVYGDAENIIISKNDARRISYNQVVLEDPDSQKEICSILDGGEYIFDMRSKKYNIQKLIKGDSNE